MIEHTEEWEKGYAKALLELERILHVCILTFNSALGNKKDRLDIRLISQLSMCEALLLAVRGRKRRQKVKK